MHKKWQGELTVGGGSYWADLNREENFPVSLFHPRPSPHQSPFKASWGAQIRLTVLEILHCFSEGQGTLLGTQAWFSSLSAQQRVAKRESRNPLHRFWSLDPSWKALSLSLRPVGSAYWLFCPDAQTLLRHSFSSDLPRLFFSPSFSPLKSKAKQFLTTAS